MANLFYLETQYRLNICTDHDTHKFNQERLSDMYPDIRVKYAPQTNGLIWKLFV